MRGIADVVPQPAVAVLRARLVTHRYGGVVGMQHLGRKDMLDQHQVQRRQQAGRGRHPVAHRRAWQGHAQALEAALAAVQRNVILILIDNDLCHEAGTGQATLDRLRRLGGHHYLAFAARAGVLDTLMLDDEDLGRLVVVLRGLVDADLGSFGAAVRAAGASDLREQQP